MVELIWDGKYRETARGREQVGPVRIALPFQTIETVNESAQDRQRSLELFASGRDTNGATGSFGATRNTSCPACSRSSPGRLSGSPIAFLALLYSKRLPFPL